MGKRWLAAIGGIAAGLIGGASPAAADAAEPLLVVVEAQPGSRVDAGEVRQRIAAELGQPVISPRDLAAAGTSDVLIVALDAGTIRVSLREGTTTRVTRVIADTTERSDRLRAIAWLAGNLARDQVSPILPRLTATNNDAPDVPAEAPPTGARAATEPPPLRVTTSPTAPAATVVGHAETPSAGIDAGWAITVAGGRTGYGFCLRDTCGAGPWVSFDNSYQVEMQHQTARKGLVVGAALESGPPSHLLGIAGFVGSHRQWGGWFLEGTVGVGVEAQRAYVASLTVGSSSTSGSPTGTMFNPQIQPAIYARAVGAIGHPISDSLDVLGRVSLHIEPSGLEGGLESDFASATVAIRLRLP